MVHPARLRPLSPNPAGTGPVVYWMSRDQRADDNWALVHAAELARGRGTPLVVLFALAPGFPGATARHYDFMLAGLAQTETRLRRRGIPLTVVSGDPAVTVAPWLDAIGAGTCVADFDPLRVKIAWKASVSAAFAGAFLEVDAHNVLPCFAVSGKREYAAATLRPKIHRRLPEFLEPFPETPSFPEANLAGWPPVDWAGLRAGLAVDATVGPVPDAQPGPASGEARLEAFLATTLDDYAARRNDPNADATSGLSPYFHFGQLAPARAALAARDAAVRCPEGAAAFLEELVVRRELADNFCLHEPRYDSLDGLPDWARKTLAEHAADPRPALYGRDAFEAAATHSALWNAAQRQLKREGRIHGYMRMYWAKKILEWSASPAEALATGLFLNDRYALDGRDPNGVVGVMWSVGGLHDRPWATRAVFGQVRYMNERGCRRKFDVDAYIARNAREAA